VSGLDETTRPFFLARNFVHLATTLPDGAPHSVTIWATVEGDRIAFFTQPGSRKARNIARDPRVALSVADAENPYRTVAVRGRVVETIEGEPAKEIVDRISHQYIGKPFPWGSGTVYLVEPERVQFVDLPLAPEAP
jgi:PPOX class probable F420-dependent enzyme